MSPCCIGCVTVGGDSLSLIAGPCVAESLDLCLRIAEKMIAVCDQLRIGYVFKASFDKANRSSVSSYRGPGLEKGLRWIEEVKNRFNVPVLSDIHETQQVAPASQVLDCLQIPAFLCRQTDLLVAAGQSGRTVNVKKGQFMAPADMKNVVDKVRSTGNNNILLTERGTSFGYNRLITDYRGIVQMREYAPVVFDATHSVQEPGGLGTASGGKREFAPSLASAAMAVGADALFIETHPDPDHAKSDGPNMIPLDQMAAVLDRCRQFFDLHRRTRL
ncbi:MAG: 3-deoxy-8-phosphooctulonate synthase [Phycisphaerae bacterium]